MKRRTLNRLSELFDDISSIDKKRAEGLIFEANKLIGKIVKKIGYFGLSRKSDLFRKYLADNFSSDNLLKLKYNEIIKLHKSIKSGSFTESFGYKLSKQLNLSGHVYIFDFDDTLMYSPEWFASPKVDSNGIVVDPGDSPAIQDAVNLLKRISQDPQQLFKKNKAGQPAITMFDYPAEYRNISLKKIQNPLKETKTEYIFVLTDSSGRPVEPTTFKKFFSSKVLRPNNIQVIDNNLVGIMRDYEFYMKPSTVGTMGPIKEIFDIYKKHSNNAVILTARSGSKGIEDAIEKKILEHGAPKPIYTITRPQSSQSSGEYKARIIAGFAKNNKIDHITFYDDRDKYLDAIKKRLLSDPDLANKVTLIKVHSVENKGVEQNNANDDGGAVHDNNPKQVIIPTLEAMLAIAKKGDNKMSVQYSPGDSRVFCGIKSKIPFYYGEWPDIINPDDGMGWDFIIVPSVNKKAQKFMPVGYVEYKGNIDKFKDWLPLEGQSSSDDGGNAKIILAPGGKYNENDYYLITKFFSNFWQFEGVEWLQDPI